MSREYLFAGTILAIWLSACSHTHSTQTAPSAPAFPAVGKHRQIWIREIRSEADLNGYLRIVGTLGPLGYLSPDARTRFLSSLRFNERGVTTFRYDDLAKLPTRKVNRILSLFGLQRDTEMIVASNAHTHK
jgi:hypothetical protein